MAATERRSDTTDAPAAPLPGLRERVTDWLEAQGWSYQPLPENGWLSLQYTGSNGSWRVIIEAADDDGSRLLAWSIYPVFVPAARRGAVAEAIARINYGLNIGSFELDFGDGELRVKTVCDTGLSSLGDELIERTLLANLYHANRYHAVLLGIAFGGLAPDSVGRLPEDAPAGATLQ